MIFYSIFRNKSFSSCKLVLVCFLFHQNIYMLSRSCIWKSKDLQRFWIFYFSQTKLVRLWKLNFWSFLHEGQTPWLESTLNKFCLVFSKLENLSNLIYFATLPFNYIRPPTQCRFYSEMLMGPLWHEIMVTLKRSENNMVHYIILFIRHSHIYTNMYNKDLYQVLTLQMFWP